MSKAIAVMGESGSGKTTSIRTLNPDTTFYIDCDGKGLGFKKWRETYNSEKKNYMKTRSAAKVLNTMTNISLKAPHIKTIVIDTANALMDNDEFSRMNEKGYDKWADLAYSVYQIVTIANDLRDDLTIVVLFHSMTYIDEVTGKKFTRILTNGKKLNKVVLEKYFFAVFLAKRTDEGVFVFETKAHYSTAKTPYGAFDTEEIPNDMQFILDTLEDY